VPVGEKPFKNSKAKNRSVPSTNANTKRTHRITYRTTVEGIIRRKSRTSIDGFRLRTKRRRTLRRLFADGGDDDYDGSARRTRIVVTVQRPAVGTAPAEGARPRTITNDRRVIEPRWELGPGGVINQIAPRSCDQSEIKKRRPSVRCSRPPFVRGRVRFTRRPRPFGHFRRPSPPILLFDELNVRENGAIISVTTRIRKTVGTKVERADEHVGSAMKTTSPCTRSICPNRRREFIRQREPV